MQKCPQRQQDAAERACKLFFEDEASKEKGRIGLHSLPQANSFYAYVCGMTDLGQDATYENLRYFELEPERARNFIEKGKGE